jgi:hypothetical protein
MPIFNWISIWHIMIHKMYCFIKGIADHMAAICERQYEALPQSKIKLQDVLKAWYTSLHRMTNYILNMMSVNNRLIAAREG